MPVARSAAMIAILISLAVCLAAPPTAAGKPTAPEPYDVVRWVAEANLLDARSGWLRPAPAYHGSWVRDSFWTSAILGADVGRRSLAHFGARLTPDGQAPTKLESPNGEAHYYDDESTLIYLIWAYRDNGPPTHRRAQAWSWVSNHVADGFYWTQGGTFHTWHDTFLFAERDVASYNQGLYAVAAMAAQRMGLATPREVALAARAYRRLFRADLGYLPVSLKLDHHDASALVGEFLARQIFKVSLLDDSAVVSTVRRLPRAGDGFLILSARDGSYLDASAFFTPVAPGRYQNGGSWVLYDALSWASAWMAGMDEARAMPIKRLTAETNDGTLYEYLPTGPDARQFPLHRDYGWSSFAWYATMARRGETRPFLQ